MTIQTMHGRVKVIGHRNVLARDHPIHIDWAFFSLMFIQLTFKYGSARKHTIMVALGINL